MMITKIVGFDPIGWVLGAVMGLVLLLVVPGPAHGTGDMTSQDPIEITVVLGNAQGTLRFFPDTLILETGKLYRLILLNRSPSKHYFSSDGFSRAVFTRKIQVAGTDGAAIAEIKGAIREIEVYPGGRAEWWFVPVKAGKFGDMKCTNKRHAERGMVGSILIR